MKREVQKYCMRECCSKVMRDLGRLEARDGNISETWMKVRFGGHGGGRDNGILHIRRNRDAVEQKHLVCIGIYTGLGGVLAC